VAAGGADVIELGVPFSDPMADGQVIELAAIRALRAGAHLPQLFELVQAFRTEYDTPLLFMTYWNPILQYGPARACAEAKEASVDGFLISTCPRGGGRVAGTGAPAGTGHYLPARPHQPGTPHPPGGPRGSGFIYCISRLGVTGARAELPSDLPALVAKIKALTDKPVRSASGCRRPSKCAMSARWPTAPWWAARW